MPPAAGEPQLPLPLTPILGRERELAETARLLETTRLLSITGAGGSGKTRLGIELAHRMLSRYQHVIWVDLAPVSEPELIGQQMLDALSIREAPMTDVIEVVVDSLRDRPSLVVLDNCEHLIHACAVLAERILRNCPRTSILTTTREALGIAGEQTWLVPPLDVPDAVQLFVERARAVLPSFAPTADNAETIARICTRLDGIPLAIELAAARVKVFSVDQIAERLSDAFRLLSSGSRTLPRHRTIRETIDWSYRLLSEDEQTLLRRLAVFAGTFSFAAAEEICSCDVLSLLAALVDKSLVLREDHGDTRYRLLETVRQFAAEKLFEAGEAQEMRERHARHFLAMIERAEPRVFAGAVDPPTLQRIDLEIGNVRAVFDWAEEDPPSRAEIELRLVYALHWYWFARAHFHEARRRTIWSAATSVAALNVDEVVRAKAIVAAGDAAVWQGDWNALHPSVDEAVQILRQTNDPTLASALTLQGVAFAFADKDDYRAAKAFDEAKTIARQNGVHVGLALVLYWSGLAAQLRGDWNAARAEFDECRAVGEQLRNLPAIGHSNTVLGYVELHEKHLDEAIRCFRRALEVHAQIDDRWGLTQVVEGIGLALVEHGNAETGTRLLAAAEAAWPHLGARPGRDEEFAREKDARIRRALGDEKLRVILASGAAMPYEAMVRLARDEVENLASAPAASRLRVRALGPLELERDGVTLEGERRARELLLFLLTQPKGVTKEQIGAALWPDADAARIRNNVHVTLHRLRKLLGGAEWVVSVNEIYSVDHRHIDFDADAFEHAANAALRTRHADALTRAAAMVRGTFFANGPDAEWAHEMRDRIRDLHAQVLTALGAWEQLLAVDPTNEEAARHLMSERARSGDTAGASRVYERLLDALRAIGEHPDAETERLHRVTSA